MPITSQILNIILFNILSCQSVDHFHNGSVEKELSIVNAPQNSLQVRLDERTTETFLPITMDPRGTTIRYYQEHAPNLSHS